jgi:hypothetical protein
VRTAAALAVQVAQPAITAPSFLLCDDSLADSFEARHDGVLGDRVLPQTHSARVVDGIGQCPWGRSNARFRERWLAFMRNHREVIAAMDFFTVPTITLGFVVVIGPAFLYQL